MPRRKAFPHGSSVTKVNAAGGPAERRVTASLPGNLSMEDWMIMREVMEAVRQAIPDASSKQPRQVLEFVLNALRMAQVSTIDCPEKD